jgi:hypothetical protein
VMRIDNRQRTGLTIRRGHAGRAKSLRRARTPCDTNTLRESLTTRKRYVNYFLSSRNHVMRTRRLHARLAYVVRVDIRARVTYAAATPAVRKVLSGTRQHPATIADNAKALS